MIEFIETKSDRIRQGDIFKNTEFLESSVESGGVQEIKKIVFPFTYVLTQDCDLAQHTNMIGKTEGNKNSQLISVIVAPLYNWIHFRAGEHLSELDINTEPLKLKSTKYQNIIKNNDLRFHFFNFENTKKIYQEAVIDFKQYFTVTNEYLLNNYNDDWVIHVSELYREQISQRFSAFLSRIGLPERN